jgi:hypothetical protein
MTLRWQTCVAGGVLGLSLLNGTAAWSQTPSRSAYTPVQAESVQPVEAMIESAWLADPLTFQYALKAVVTTQGVELRGYVPTQMLKQRAVTVAQNISQVGMVDHIQIQPNMEIMLPGMAGPSFTEEATERLAKVNPDQHSQVSVQMGVGGVVTLNGQANTLEEKLRYARSLRGLTGCAAVRNNIVIGGAVAAVVPPPPAPASAPTSAYVPPKPAPIIRMEPTPPPVQVQVKHEPSRVRVEIPVKHVTPDTQVKPAVAKSEVPVKPQMLPPQDNKPLVKSPLPMTPPTVKQTADKPVTPPTAPVKPAVAKQETPSKGTPVQIIFD